ncbi:chitin synthase chs-1-like [Scyliorhinus torazame]|uniref:chitin synthase chs-1-like n=1 Tax=Scyliorhinus torazame TaxID=75743 RepID=UPI003B594BD3
MASAEILQLDEGFHVNISSFSHIHLQSVGGKDEPGTISVLLTSCSVLLGEMVKENTIVTPTSLFFISMIILFVSTAMLHPQEFPLVIYGLLYIICIPSGYLLLPIYSMVNMNNVSWGTRETATPKKKKKKKPEQLLRYEKKWKCICWDIEFSVKEDKKEQTQYADRIVDEEDEMEPTVEDNWISNLQEQSLHIVLAEEELDEVEIPFWNDLINMYLKPIEEDKDRQTEIEKQLKSLRNKATFLFFIINVLWIVSTFILQAIGPDIHIKIPKLLSNGNYSETENLSIEPLGFFFLISFAGLLAIQFFAMLYHRITTLIHFVAYKGTEIKPQQSLGKYQQMYKDHEV